MMQGVPENHGVALQLVWVTKCKVKADTRDQSEVRYIRVWNEDQLKKET